MTLTEGARLALVMVVSLAFGSFVGAVVLRLPAGETMLGRSHCPKCRAVLEPRDMVPVASYVLLGGRCRRCGVPQGKFYPAVELAALALGVWAWTASSGWLMWASCAFAWTLLALALIDFEHYVLPDLLTVPLVVAGLAVAATMAQSSWEPGAILDNVAGAVIGYALFALVAWAYRKGRGREGLGGGDAKLLAAIGAWVGASGLASVVLIASVMALVVALGARSFRFKGARLEGAMQERVPFGPALAAAGWLVWLYGPLTFGLG